MGTAERRLSNCVASTLFINPICGYRYIWKAPTSPTRILLVSGTGIGFSCPPDQAEEVTWNSGAELAMVPKKLQARITSGWVKLVAPILHHLDTVPR